MYAENMDAIIFQAKAIASVLDQEEIMTDQGKYDYVMNYHSHLVDFMNEKANLSCKKGCSFCCHDKISLSLIEADILQHKVDSGIIPGPNLERLKLQKEAKDYHKDLSWMDKRCGFLSDDNLCTIYEHRPLICRSYNSTDEPEKCKMNNSGERSSHTQAYNIDMVALEICMMMISGGVIEIHKIF